MAFNFTDDLGFVEGQPDPSDFLTIRTLDGENISTNTAAKFTDLGVYVETQTGSAFGHATVFTPWSFIKYIQQNR